MGTRLLMTALLVVAGGAAAGGVQGTGGSKPGHLRAIRKLLPPQKNAFYKRHQIKLGELGDVMLTAASPMDAASGYYLEATNVYWSPQTGIDMLANSTASVWLGSAASGSMHVLTFSNNWAERYPCTATAYGAYSNSKRAYPTLSATTGKIGSGAPPFSMLAPKNTLYVEFKIALPRGRENGYSTGINGVTISSVGG